jgi:two-component system OmpR family response regulator
MMLVNARAAIVLDVMIPIRDGFEVCRELRASGSWVPVLMLTARDAAADRIAGLDTGADDSLTKPFEFDELLAHDSSVRNMSCPCSLHSSRSY